MRLRAPQAIALFLYIPRLSHMMALLKKNGHGWGSELLKPSPSKEKKRASAPLEDGLNNPLIREEKCVFFFLNVSNTSAVSCSTNFNGRDAHL